MSMVIERAKEIAPLSKEAIDEIVGYEPVNPNMAAERDVKDILARMSAEFDAIVETMVRGTTATPKQ